MRKFEWDDKKVIEFAIKWLNDRVRWAIMHDYAAVPAPIQMELEKYKSSKEEIVEKEPFVWTDSLVQEYAHNLHYNVGYCDIRNQEASIIKFKTDIQNSPSIKAGSGTANDVLNSESGVFTGKAIYDFMNSPSQPQNNKEMVEVDRINYANMGRTFAKKGSLAYIVYEFGTTAEIPKEKYPAIKQAIERELNNEYFNIDRINERLDQLREIEEAERKAFEAGKEYEDGYRGSHFFAKYPTFQDYKNSLK